MEAVGAYLWRLREAREPSRKRAATKLGTTDAQLGRIEKGEIDTRSSFLFRFLEYVEGDEGQLRALMKDKDATFADGERVASLWLEQQREKMQYKSEAARRQAAFVYRRLADLLEEGHSPQAALRIVETELAQHSQNDS